MKKLIFLELFFFLLALSSVGQAAVTVNVERMTVSGQVILPGSEKTAILKIGVKSNQPGTEGFASCVITFTNVNLFDASVDLLPIGNYTAATAGNYGLTLYQNSTHNQAFADAVFKGYDYAYPCNLTQTSNGPLYYTYTLTLADSDPVGHSGKGFMLAQNIQYTFFVVIKTSDNIDYGDKFYATCTVSGVSASTNTITCVLPIDRPTELDAVPGINVVTLYWVDNSLVENGFQIQRKIDTQDDIWYSTIGWVSGSDKSYGTYDDTFSDTTLDYGYTYTYRVRAYKYYDYYTLYSKYSNKATAKPYSFGAGGSTGCFIATAAFGTPLAEEVIVLKKFRDNVLLKTVSGKEFVRFYYAFSPPIADFIRNKSLLKTIVREYLEPLIWFSKQITK